MLVKASWEFDVDISDFDEKHVDIKGLAIDLTKREIEYNLSNNEFSAEDFKYEIIQDELKENNMEQIKLEMILDVDTKENAEALKKLEHHAECLLDLDSYPEIKSVHGVKVIRKADETDFIVSREEFKVREDVPGIKGDIMTKVRLENPTVGDIISLLSELHPETEFYTSGSSSFTLYINKKHDFCTVDESDTVYE